MASDELFKQFPETASLSKEDIQELLHNQTYFDAFFTMLNSSTQRDQQREAALTRNTSATETNMQLKPELDALRADAARTFHQAHELMQSWTALEAQQSQAEQRFDFPTQFARLKAATTASEKESDALAASFQRGDLSQEEFVKSYKASRRVYHRRALQLDKGQSGRIQWP